MAAKAKICIIDLDEMRRTVIEGALAHSYEITAMRQPLELTTDWPDADAALVADEYGYVTQVRTILGQHRKALPIIAYGVDIDIDEAISAIYAGAIDCIDLRAHRRDLEPRIELALRRLSPEFRSHLLAMRSAGENAEFDEHIPGMKKKLSLRSLKDAVQTMLDGFR